jgi:DNA-binding response OmpR family regulator
MGSPRILLVDDEEALTRYLAPILERAGFSVVVAHDGNTAFRYVQEQPVDLIVLDLLLPDLDGREVCRRLRAAGIWTPVIMLTRVTRTLDRVISLEEGADDYLSKPFDPHELIARIRAVLRRAQKFPSALPFILPPSCARGIWCWTEGLGGSAREGRFWSSPPGRWPSWSI